MTDRIMHKTRQNHTEINTINGSLQNNLQHSHDATNLDLMARHNRWSQVAVLSVTEACNHIVNYAV